MLVDTLIDYRIQTVLQLQIEKQKKKIFASFLCGNNRWFLLNGMTAEDQDMFSRILDKEAMEEERYELERDLEMEPEVAAVQEQMNAAIADLNMLRVIKGMYDLYDVDEEESVEENLIPVSCSALLRQQTELGKKVSMLIEEARNSLNEIIRTIESEYRCDREFQFRKVLDYHNEILDSGNLNPCHDGNARRKWEEERYRAGRYLKDYEIFKLLFK